MLHLKRYIALIAVLLVPVVGRAQEPKAAALPKVGVMDFERAVLESAEGQRVAAAFNAKVSDRQKEMDAKQKDIDDLTDKLRKQSGILSDAQKSQITRDIQTKSNDMTRRRDDIQTELEGLKAELFKPVADAAMGVARRMGAEKGILLIDISNDETNSLVYFNPKVDYTEELKLLINAEIKGPATAAAKPAGK
jgi:Skp family chaperone for outer membrane proteins